MLERSNDNNDRLYTIAKPAAGPGAAYLRNKRGSVFQKNVDMNNVGTFVAPVFAKTDEERDNILKLLKDSFLTKTLD